MVTDGITEAIEQNSVVCWIGVTDRRCFGRASSRVIPAPCTRDAARRREDTDGDAPECPVAWPGWDVAEVVLTGKLTRDRAVHRGQFGGRCWKKDPAARILSERPHRIGRSL